MFAATLFILALCFSESFGQRLRACERPQAVKHGQYDIKDGGLYVEYTCLAGYTLVGPSHIVCTAKGWAASPPICVSSGCVNLEPPVNGRLWFSAGGAVAEVQCDRGYQPSKNYVVVCDGRYWNTSTATCLARAEEKQDEEMSSEMKMSPEMLVNYTTQSHSDLLRQSDYSCVNGESKISPPRSKYATVTVRWERVDGEPRLYAVYKCQWGYLDKGPTKNVYCRNGAWVGVKPTCVEAVPALLPELHSKDKHKDVLRTGSLPLSHYQWLLLADYSCVSPSILPPNIQHSSSSLQYSMVNYKSRLYAKYLCDDGYQLVGDKEYMYCRNKKWEGDGPTCVQGRANNRGIGGCASSNGGCQQLCQNSLSGVRCSCHPGFTLQRDRRSCRPVPIHSRRTLYKT